MKLHEIMSGIGKGLYEVEPLNWWDIGGYDDEDLIYAVLGRSHGARDSVALDAVVAARLQRVVLEQWLCTDTHVGQALYLLDGEPACITSQGARRSRRRFRFVLDGRTRLIAFCNALIAQDEAKPSEGSITYDSEITCLLTPEDVAGVSSYSGRDLHPHYSTILR